MRLKRSSLRSRPATAEERGAYIVAARSRFGRDGAAGGGLDADGLAADGLAVHAADPAYAAAAAAAAEDAVPGAAAAAEWATRAVWWSPWSSDARRPRVGGFGSAVAVRGGSESCAGVRPRAESIGWRWSRSCTAGIPHAGSFDCTGSTRDAAENCTVRHLRAECIV